MPVTPPPRSRSDRDRVALRYRTTAPAQGRRKHGSGCGLLVIGLLLALVLVGVLSGILVNRFNKVAETIVQQDPRQQTVAEEPADADEEASVSASEPVALPEALSTPFKILLIGVDKRETPDEGVRSDTLIVVHVNPQEKWASMLSIPRDSVVQIPRVGQQKINFAYTYGFMHPDSLYGKGTSPEASGGALAAEAVENFLDVRIDYIAQVDFRGFERLVDMIDGIKVDVQKPILDAEYPTENFGFERIYIPAGLQILDGYTALRYARSRHSGTDFERSRRQQQVLRAFLEEFQRRGLLDQIDMLSQMVENLQQSVNTTMPIGDLQVIRGLADFAQNINPDDIVQLSINPNDVGVVLEDGSDIYWNEQDIATLVKKLEAGPEAIEEEASLQVQNGTNRAGLASRVTSFLQNEGFETLPADDAPELYNRTMIIDYSGQFPNTRQQLADLLLVADRYVYATPPAEAPPQPLNVDIVVIVGQDYRE